MASYQPQHRPPEKLQFHSRRGGPSPRSGDSGGSLVSQTSEPPAQFAKLWRSKSDLKSASTAPPERMALRSIPSVSPAPEDDVLELRDATPSSGPRLVKGSPGSNTFAGSSPSVKARSLQRSVSSAAKPINGASAAPFLDLARGELPDPLPTLSGGLDEADLRESAFELLVGVNGPQPSLSRSVSSVATSLSSPSSEEGGTMVEAASSRFRMALGLAGPEKLNEVEGGEGPATPMEIVTRQLGISDFSDRRTRKALARAVATQFHRRTDNLIAPLELLLNLGSADFASQRDYVRWKRRQLSLLEEGLVHCPGAGGDPTSTERLRKLLTQLASGELDAESSQNKQALKAAVLAKAERGEGRGKVGLTGRQSGTSCYWADGYPLNVHLYQAMLQACFDGNRQEKIIEEVDDVLEVVRKGWNALGISPAVHNATFAWVHFRQHVRTGAKDVGLLEQAEYHVRELWGQVLDTPAAEQKQFQSGSVNQLLKALLGAMQGYAEKRLLAYHDAFPDGAMGVMEHLVAVSLMAETVLQSRQLAGYRNQSQQRALGPAQEKAETYVRSSVKGAFAEIHEAATTRRRSLKGNPLSSAPVLVTLAVDAGELAAEHMDRYCPSMREWAPCPGGVAAATVHQCYSKELKQYLSGVTIITQEAAQVLLAADQLEKQLIQFAVEDGGEAEDGGASVMKEMPPFEADKQMQELLLMWQRDRLAKFNEWVDRTLETEKWDPNALRGHFAPSLVDVFRLFDETLEGFFELPMPPQEAVLVALVKGMEAALRQYISRLLSNIGSKDQFVGPLPPLTRYKKDIFAKYQLQFNQQAPPNKKPTPSPAPSSNPAANGSAPGKKPPPNAKLESITLPRLCCRINTLAHCDQEIGNIKNKIKNGWENALAPMPPSPSPNKDTSSKAKGGTGLASLFANPLTPKAREQNIPLAPPLPPDLVGMFDSVREDIDRGIMQLCEFAAYRIVFCDIRSSLSERLYMGGVSRARMVIVIEALRNHLIDIVDNIQEQLRDKLVLALLKVLVAALLRVLLAATPQRAYTVRDATLLEDDLAQLQELFVDGGEGLKESDVDKAIMLPSQILHLFSCETDDLIKNFEAANRKGGGGKGETHGGNVIPPLKGGWNPTDANTILRVICYRADRKGSKYLKKLYDLPKDLKNK